jgi:hypothetical protein
MAYNEGQWLKVPVGADSSLYNKGDSTNAEYLNIKDLKLGTVLIPQPEPVYKESSASVNLVTGGILTNVAWPGPQVDMNPTGIIPGGVAIGIHGLWEAPLSGQQVLVGFVEGSSQNPIIIQKYSYNASTRLDLEPLHILPLTLKLIGPTDVILGQHVGSFIALRGTLPLPGEIDIFALTVFTVTTLGAAFITIGGALTENIGGAKTTTVGGAAVITAGAAITITAGATMSLSAGAAMSILSGGVVSIIGIPGVNINTGIFPVACVGIDIIPTLLGPQVIIPGPGRIPTGLTTT